VEDLTWITIEPSAAGVQVLINMPSEDK